MQKNLRVFITGASSGIGKALANEYAKRGLQISLQFNNQNSLSEKSISSELPKNSPNNLSEKLAVIALVARRKSELAILAAELQQKYNVTCVIYALDVRDAAALDAAANDFMQQHGTPHIVIAGAGVSCGTLTEDKEDLAAFQAIFDINVQGMVHTFQPFIAAMKVANKIDKNFQGQLVGVASVAGIRGIPGSGAYSASKAAVISYLESLRAEMQHFNIHVSTIAPGYIRTPMTEINQYKMPFLMDADVFASKFVDAVEAKVRFKIIPWQMGVIAKIMRVLPPWLWDYLMKNAPHKKRLDWDWL